MDNEKEIEFDFVLFSMGTGVCKELEMGYPTTPKGKEPGLQIP